MPVQTDAFPIPYTVSHRKIKYPRLEFGSGTLRVILPEGQDESRIIEKHRQWIKQKYAFINKITNNPKPLYLESRSLEELQFLVKDLVKTYSDEIGHQPNRVTFRHLRTKWASCSKKGNLTINSRINLLPESLIQYIVYHEMAHLIHANHDYFFWKHLDTKFDNVEEIEESLCSFWFAICQKEAAITE